MSIKSLLQIILFLLIILIIGGIYFVYFYSKPLNNELTMSKNLNEIDIKIIDKIINLKKKDNNEGIFGSIKLAKKIREQSFEKFFIFNSSLRFNLIARLLKFSTCSGIT